MLFRRFAQNMIGQQRDIFSPLMECRNFQVNHIEAVVEIFTEFVFFHRLG